MSRKITPIALLWASLATLPAEADSGQCMAPIYIWELTLTQVAAEAGQPDLKALAAALGNEATLRGGYFDPARPEEPVRIDLTSRSGQLKLLGERSP